MCERRHALLCMLLLPGPIPAWLLSAAHCSTWHACCQLRRPAFWFALKRTPMPARAARPAVRLMPTAAGHGCGQTVSRVIAHPQSSIWLPDKPPLSMSSMCQVPASNSHRGSGEGRAVGSWLIGPGDASSVQRRSNGAGGSIALPAPLRTTCSCVRACPEAENALMQCCIQWQQKMAACLGHRHPLRAADQQMTPLWGFGEQHC